jgi:HSP20 family molecular chaperone IbpA
MVKLNLSETKDKVILMPEITSWADDEHNGYHIEIKLPGVEKDAIKLKMHEDSFFIKGETEETVYIGSYPVCCEISPEKAKATYKNGLLKVDVPFQDPMEGAIDVKIE